MNKQHSVICSVADTYTKDQLIFITKPSPHKNWFSFVCNFCNELHFYDIYICIAPLNLSLPWSILILERGFENPIKLVLAFIRLKLYISHFLIPENYCVLNWVGRKLSFLEARGSSNLGNFSMWEFSVHIWNNIRGSLPIVDWVEIGLFFKRHSKQQIYCLAYNQKGIIYQG